MASLGQTFPRGQQFHVTVHLVTGVAELSETGTMYRFARSTGMDVGSHASEEPPTVLVVEGDVLIRMAVSAYLRECGYRVIEADGADEAKVLLRAAAKVDVAFVDMGGPGDVSSIGLAPWIQNERP